MRPAFPPIGMAIPPKKGRIMSIRRPKISRVSDMRADVKHDTSVFGWIIDNDIFIGFMLWGMGTLLVVFLIMIAASA
jgi:hypothetical protein